MRRTKLILAAVAAVAAMMVVAAPAMADVEFRQSGDGVSNSFSLDGGGGSFSSQGVLSLGGSSHGDISFDGVDIDRNDIGDGGFLLVGGLSSIG